MEAGQQLEGGGTGPEERDHNWTKWSICHLRINSLRSNSKQGPLESTRYKGTTRQPNST